jgi:hypothetical protein
MLKIGKLYRVTQRHRYFYKTKDNLTKKINCFTIGCVIVLILSKDPNPIFVGEFAYKVLYNNDILWTSLKEFHIKQGQLFFDFEEFNIDD